jgi:hypothetical protein
MLSVISPIGKSGRGGSRAQPPILQGGKNWNHERPRKCFILGLCGGFEGGDVEYGAVAREPKITSVKSLYQHLADVADVLAGDDLQSLLEVGNAPNYLKVTSKYWSYFIFSHVCLALGSHLTIISSGLDK